MSGGIVTFDGAPIPGHINFGVGQPSPDLLPVEVVRKASEAFFKNAHPLNLNYGVREGDEAFRESLAAFLSREYGLAARPGSLFVTAGNSQALDFVCTQFTRAGDTVFVEEPSYFLAFQIFRDHELNIVGIPTDEQGMRVDVLERELEKIRPAMVYTIPSFQNPGGQSMNAERRRKLVSLSEEYGFLIAADEVYQLLSYYEPPPVAFGSLSEEQGENGTILSLGSFSKILAPGLRLGWIQTSPGLVAKMLASGALNSGGSFNHMTAQIVRQAIDLGLQQEHLEYVRASYRGRVDAMDQALHEELGELARWSKPLGGYFFWLELADGRDSRELRKRAGDFQTGFQPGSLFSSSGAFANCLRLSFAHYGEDDIREGISRLAALLRD